MKKAVKKSKAKRITLNDVVVHFDRRFDHMDLRLTGLTAAVEKNSRDVQENTSDIQANTAAIRDLTLRVDSLDQDLKAVIGDSIKIRKHIGMPVALEE